MRLLDLLSVESGTSWIAVADAVVKATLVFLAAGLASVILRRRSAALRHIVWTLALATGLVLPALSVAMPRWQLNLITIENVPQPAPSFHQPAARVRSRAVQVAPAANSQTPAADAPVNAPASGERSNLSLSSVLFALWVSGALIILGRLFAGIIAVRWMSRRTARVTDAPWLEQAKSLATEVGVSPRLTFLRSTGAAMPMAWGLFRPSVLMPADADHWPAERLRIVLLHELAHVKRRDCLTHMLAQLACALHWFNPLAWMAARQVRTERERACDDLVLAAGTRGSDYADQLIEIARVMRSGRFPLVLAGATLAMAQRSELEGRLLAILDPSVPRAGLSPLRIAATTAVFALGVLPLAAVQPWHVSAAEPPQQPAALAQAAPVPTSQAVAEPAPAVESASQDSRRLQQTARRAGDIASGVVGPAVATEVQTHVQTAVQSAVQSNVMSSVQSTVASAAATGVQTALSSVDVNAAIKGAWSGNLHWQGEQNQRAPRDAQGKADPRTVAALTAALKDSDKDVRETALHALVQLRDPSVFDPLVQALSDASADVREQAAFGLGQLRDRRAVDPLIGALKDQNGDVREQAAFALGQIRDRAAVSGLSAALKDTDDDVREQAVFALGQIRDASAVDAIVTAVRDTKADVRQQAVFALGQIRDRRAVEPLISALKDPTADVREQAAFALGQIRDGRAVEALVVALKDSVADVRQQAAFALGQIRDPRAIDGLTAALKDASADVRQQAAFALGQLAR
jgi:HEAT repeat protein/beta-lactamase regulating signal transducer with metallopeptidase domain